MDRRRDGAARRPRTILDMKSCHRNATRPHAHRSTDMWMASCRRGAVRDGACGAVFRRGFIRRVDRPRAPRNLRFSARGAGRKSHRRQRRGDPMAEGSRRRIN